MFKNKHEPTDAERNAESINQVPRRLFPDGPRPRQASINGFERARCRGISTDSTPRARRSLSGAGISGWRSAGTSIGLASRLRRTLRTPIASNSM